MREFQNLTRAEIRTDIDDSIAQARALGDFADARSAEADKVRANGMEPLRLKAPLVQQSRDALRQSSELWQRVQALQFELHLRDTPDFVAKFGPGAD